MRRVVHDTERVDEVVRLLAASADVSFSALAWTKRIRSATPITSARSCAMRSDSPDRSTAVSSAPARAKLIESVPMPQPTSRTRFPLQRSNSAKAGMCGSTRYLRASTSSKYSFDPTGLGECRMLQGRASQYRLNVGDGLLGRSSHRIGRWLGQYLASAEARALKRRRRACPCRAPIRSHARLARHRLPVARGTVTRARSRCSRRPSRTARRPPRRC